VWPGSPVVVSSVLSQKDKIPVCVDASGLVRAAWDDERNAGSSGDIYAQNVNGDGSLGVSVPAPVAFCFGDGTATACPCGNAGAPGSGCANSLNPNGALLAGSGAASISADTLVLQGSGMPNSSALYFQGTSQQNGGLGTVFGDGLRCAGGSLIRLSTKANTAGASQFPAAGDPPVSVAGLVAAPGVRDYQVWYRNAAAYCTAATFNLTNGLEVPWAP
jgi:hypothetical protein